MSAKALLDVNNNPTRQEVRDWFTKSRNICRCTGYKPIIDAVMAAAKVVRGEMTIQESRRSRLLPIRCSGISTPVRTHWAGFSVPPTTATILPSRCPREPSEYRNGTVDLPPWQHQEHRLLGGGKDARGGQGYHGQRREGHQQHRHAGFPCPEHCGFPRQGRPLYQQIHSVSATASP